MAGAPTALTATDAARAVADAAYPNGFVPNVVLANGLPGCEIRGHNLCYKSHTLYTDRISLIY